MSLVNLTPHPVVLLREDGSKIELAKCPTPPRVEQIEAGHDPINGVRAKTVIMGKPVGLPEPVEGTILIVSRPLASAAPERMDLYFPDELERDDDGNVVGCRALGCFVNGDVPIDKYPER